MVVSLVLVAACAGKSNHVGQSGGSGASGGATGGDAASGGTTGGSGGSGGRGSGGSGGDAMAAGGSGGDGTPRGGSGGDGASAGRTGSGGTSATGGAGGSGGTGEGGETNATGGTGGTQVTPITSCTGDFSFLGTWEGSILDFYFEPMTPLRLVLVRDEASGVVSGTLTYGEGDPPPPPESADIPYPPGFWDDGPERFDRHIEPWPGYPHTIVRGAGCDASLRFGISSAEIFDAWCAMQEPVFTPNFGWGCTLMGGGSSDQETCTVTTEDGQTDTYPAWKCSACGFFAGGQGVCACDEHGCFANLEPTHTYDLDIVENAEGSVLSGPDAACPDCTVRLERVE